MKMNITRRGLAGAITGAAGLAGVAGTAFGMPKSATVAEHTQDAVLARIRAASKLTGIPAERIKITSWQPDTCECRLEYVWDNATVDNPEKREHVPFAARCCKHHACHTTAKAALEAVWAENGAKNVATGKAAQEILLRTEGVQPFNEKLAAVISTIRWEFDGDRRLKLTLPDEHKHLLAHVRSVVHSSVEVV